MIAATAIIHNLNSVTIKFAGGEPTLSINDMLWCYDYLTEKFSTLKTKLNFLILKNTRNKKLKNKNNFLVFFWKLVIWLEIVVLKNFF